MALKDILVCLDPTDAGQGRLPLAATIAREHRAHLSATLVLSEELRAVPPSGRPSLAEIVEERFREEVRPHAIEGDWHLFEPGESAGLKGLLSAVDLVICGQVSPDHHPPVGFRPDDILVDSGRPVLIIPYAGTFAAVGRRVLIAWDGTREATRALHDALPLMSKAEAATVMTVRAREASFAHDAPLLERLVRHLGRHGVAARTEETLGGDVPISDLLLSRAADLDADLIVAGAYHHSPLREALLGGVSRELLDHMTVPVLMSH